MYLISSGGVALHARDRSRWCSIMSAGGIGFPPGRGRLWAIIQRRQTFCARIQSAFPELEHRQRRADLFAGVQLEARQLLAAANPQAASPRRGRTRRPIGPASRRPRSPPASGHSTLK